MTPYEKLQKQIEQYKSESVMDIENLTDEIQRQLPLLSKSEKFNITQEFFNWAEEKKDKNALIYCYAFYLKALYYFFAEEYEKTLELSRAAQELFLEQKKEVGIGICKNLEGSSYRTLGNLEMGLKYLWEAYEILNSQDKFNHSKFACGFNIAGIYFELKNFREAEKVFREVLERATQQSNALWISLALNGLGNVYLKEAKYDEANEYLKRGLELNNKNKNLNFESKSLTDLGVYFTETKDFEKAIELHKEALKIREEIHLYGGSITNMISLGEIYFRTGREAQAIEFLMMGLELAEKIKLKPKVYQIHQILSSIFESEKNLEKSIYHYKKFHEIREEVEHEDAVKKLKNLQLIFEAEQTKKENIIIKKQKKEIEFKNIELQETIDELTIAKAGKKARAITLVIAIFLFIIEELVIHYAVHLIPEENYYVSFIAKAVIIFSLKPIDSATEHYLLKKLIKRKKREVILS